MANYFTTCCKCGIHFQGQTATSLCYDCLEAENLALKHRLQCILERAKPHAKELPQNATHIRTNARDACTWIAFDIEGFLKTISK